MSSSPTDLPATMAGVIIDQTGGTDVLQYRTDLPVPTPKPGEVLVRNDAIGVNYIDTYFRTGLYPPPSFPYALGREGAGTVVAVGPPSSPSSSDTNTPTFTPGDRVAYLAPSAYAAYVAAPTLHTYTLPAGVSPRLGAAAILQGLTALTLIRDAHHVQRGDWVLVHAAAGGVGQWLCRLLRATGARVIGTASSREKREVAREAGAEVVVASEAAVAEGGRGLVERVRECTAGRGVEVVLDGVGRDTFEASLECVARKGSLVSFGNASGAVPPVTISRLAPKNVKLLRPTLFPYIATRAEFEAYADELFALVAKGEVEVPVHETYPLSEVARAHSDIEGRKTMGKLLLTP